MANPRPNMKGLKPFKKGQVANPLGGRAHDPELKLIKRLTQHELVEIGNLVVKGDVAALKAIRKDDSQPVIKAMVAAVALKVIAKGEQGALEVLLNRLIGKVRDEMHHTGIPPAVAPQVIVSLPANGRESNK